MPDKIIKIDVCHGNKLTIMAKSKQNNNVYMIVQTQNIYIYTTLEKETT